MSNDVEDILGRFAEVARPEILRDHIPNSCIASTWITIEALRRLGINAEPLEVRLTVGNAAYKRLVSEIGRPPQSEEELEEWSNQHGADVVGVGFDPPTPGNIGGHIVALADGSHLVDASIDQVSNPATGILPPGVHIGKVDPGFRWGRRPLQQLDTDDLYIQYLRTVVPTPWKKNYDWGSNPETESAVERIENLVSADVE